jgi:hypothetical protein
MFTTERDPPVCLINLVDWYMMKYFPTSMRKFLKAIFEGKEIDIVYFLKIVVNLFSN